MQQSGRTLAGVPVAAYTSRLLLTIVVHSWRLPYPKFARSRSTRRGFSAGCFTALLLLFDNELPCGDVSSPNVSLFLSGLFELVLPLLPPAALAFVLMVLVLVLVGTNRCVVDPAITCCERYRVGSSSIDSLCERYRTGGPEGHPHTRYCCCTAKELTGKHAQRP